MPPKKAAKKGNDKKQPGDPDEYQGPDIYKELVEKDVRDLEPDLSAPDKILIKQNVEFEILVSRVQAQILSYEYDNSRLSEIIERD